MIANTGLSARPSNSITKNVNAAGNAKSPSVNQASFTKMSNATFPSINRTITNTANTVQNSLSDLYSPVKESVSEAMENTNSMMTVPVMIGIGVLTILLIIITIFRDQIAYAFQVAWDTIKNGYQPSAPSTPQAPTDSTASIDMGAVQNIVPSTKEVFNIADDKYRYSDAEPLCKAYGAELATYDQVKDAWNKGADWCNYGWVKGQAALYPTQESTYNKLQAGPEDQKNACGITGVNGGYFDNPDLRFGVNCYGTKPGKSDADERAQRKPRNMTPDALEYDRKVQEYKTKIHDIPLSPFNTTQWA